MASILGGNSGLFGSHIADGTAHRHRLAHTSAGFQQARNAEIRNHQTPIFLVNQDILRLNITMNDRARARVGVVQCAAQLLEVIDGLWRGQWAVGAGQAVAQGA
jgi:hypothetical protein